MQDENKGYQKTVLAVTYNVTTNAYTVGTCQGSSVAEMAFAVMVIIRTLKRDGYIKDFEEFLTNVKKYLDDPQFDEVKPNGQN